MRWNRAGGIGEADQGQRVLVDEEHFTRRDGRTGNPADVGLARDLAALPPNQCGWVDLA
jgi:hypothetical protein